MGPKKNKQEKAAKRKAKQFARKSRGQQDNDDNENEEFDDDVPKMKIQLEKLGLELKEVEGDGNCLFRALSDQLYGHPQKHKQLRKEVVNYMRLHRDDFEPFHSDEFHPFDRHLELMEEDGTYAGNDVLVAFARAHQVTIAIHQLNEPLWQIHGSVNGETKCDTEVHISYHNGDHYNSIRRKGQVNLLSPPNVKIIIRNDCENQEVPQNSIWGQEGTGNRIFGPEVSKEASQGQKKMSSKARRKYDKRHGGKNQEDVNEDLPEMDALSL